MSKDSIELVSIKKSRMINKIESKPMAMVFLFILSEEFL